MDKSKLNNLLFSLIFNDSSSSDEESNVVQRSKVKRRFWVHPYYRDRNVNGAFSSIFLSLNNINDPNFIIGFTRMSATQLEELFGMVGPIIEKKTLIREPLCSKMRLVITLR